MGRAPLESGWGWPWLCLNTPYADELNAQTEELMDLYDIDGFFYDAVLYDHDGCLCTKCWSELRRDGMDPGNRGHRREHNHRSARQFMERISTAIHARSPAADFCFNTRWGLHFEEESQYFTQVDLEALPTGGWGYGFYPLWARYARNFGMPMSAMTGRFHGSWADWGGLKHPDAMRFECATILAAGGAAQRLSLEKLRALGCFKSVQGCVPTTRRPPLARKRVWEAENGTRCSSLSMPMTRIDPLLVKAFEGGAVSMGDQLHPRGRLNDAIYEAVGAASMACSLVSVARGALASGSSPSALHGHAAWLRWVRRSDADR